MGFKTEQFSEATGLQYDKKTKNFWGTVSGFSVFVRYVSNRSSLVFLLYGRQPEERALQPELEEWRMHQEGISALTYRNHCLSCIIGLTPRDAVLNAVNRFDAMMHLAQELRLVPCCMACGTQYGFAPYLLDGTGVSLCGACREQTAARMGTVREQKQSEPVFHPGAAAALVIGVVLLCLLTYGVLKMGYISYLTGYAGVLASFFLMKKLGRKLTPLWAVIGVIVCCIAAASVPVFYYGQEIAAFNQDVASDGREFLSSYQEIRSQLKALSGDELEKFETAYGYKLSELEKTYEYYSVADAHQDTASCIRDMSELVKQDTYKSVRGELIKCILWGVISILVGSGVTLPKMLAEDSGRHELRELTP